jgi:hypothetical protein
MAKPPLQELPRPAVERDTPPVGLQTHSLLATASRGPMQAIKYQLLPDAQSVDQHLNKAGPIKHLRPRGRHIQELSGQIQLNGVTVLSHYGGESSFYVEPSGRVSLVVTFSGAITVRDPLGEGCAAAGDAMLLPCGSGERLYSCSASVGDVSLLVEPAAIRRVTAAIASETSSTRSSAARAVPAGHAA